MFKNQTTPIINVFFYFTYIFISKNFFKKHISKTLVYIGAFVMQFFRVAGYWKCSEKAPTPI